MDSETRQSVPRDQYKCRPRPLRRATEGTAGENCNFCLVNYYASGNDSISYHSDDKQFLRSNLEIASFSFGGKGDFALKRKLVPSSMPKPVTPETMPLKLPLASGDMILMWGTTQANWLRSVPKRKGGESGTGRINVTLGEALVRGGTEKLLPI